MILEFFKKLFFGGFGERTISVPDRRKIQKHWQEIENLMKMTGASHFEKAVIQADKLVNLAMKQKGAKGEIFADRARDFRKKFSDYDGLWKAHILRNNLVHEPDFEIYKFSAEKAIKRFHKALKDLGIL